VTLTDIVPPPLPDAAGSEVQYASEAYSLLDDFPDLPEAERFDAMVATYGFDSVWHPADMRLTRVGDKWYQSLYRVKVDDWNPRKAELLDALRRGVELEGATPQEYEGIFIEEVMQEVTIAGHAWEEMLQELPEGTFNIPGGLITRVVQAFERQLKHGGIFVSGDVADIRHTPHSPPPSGVSGVAERYKVENYVFAKRVLEHYYGLQVEFDTLGELAERFLPDGWEQYAGQHERAGIQNNLAVLMTVRRTRAEE
jgi:hypothetical protein